jgi:hypothetical protein
MKLKFYIYSLLLIFTVTSCQKNLDVFVPDPGQPQYADTNWVSAATPAHNILLLRKKLVLPFFKDSVEIGAATASIVTPAGLNCSFPSGCLNGPGNTTIWGRVNVQAALLTSKGDMLRMNRPTTTGEKLLAVGGAVFVQADKEGNELDIKPDKDIYLSFAANNSASGSKLYYGEEAIAGDFDWNKFNNDNYGAVTVSGGMYNIRCKRTGWLCPATFVDAGEKTKLSLQLPAHYTNANTIAYLVFKNKPSIVALEPKVAEKKFMSIPVPVGEEATVVVIALQGSDYYLGFSRITTIASGGEQNVSLTPYKATFNTLIQYLASL